MRESGREGKCEYHGLPFVRIEANSRRLLCEKCLGEGEEERRQRLELLRIRLNKSYLIETADLKQARKQTDRLVELFQTKNMTEAKKLINKSSPEAQRIVEALLERETREANKVLREAAEAELESWRSVDGLCFAPAYLQFQEEQPRMEVRLEELKGRLKGEIGQKLKVQLREFYCGLFEL